MVDLNFGEGAGGIGDEDTALAVEKDEELRRGITLVEEDGVGGSEVVGHVQTALIVSFLSEFRKELNSLSEIDQELHRFDSSFLHRSTQHSSQRFQRCQPWLFKGHTLSDVVPQQRYCL